MWIERDIDGHEKVRGEHDGKKTGGSIAPAPVTSLPLMSQLFSTEITEHSKSLGVSSVEMQGTIVLMLPQFL